MRVLLQARSDLFREVGGDTIQIVKTKDNLQKLGVEVDLSLELSPKLTPYDIVHLFNITRVHETYMQACNARSQEKPIALSTIYWNMDEYSRYAKKFNIIKRFLGPAIERDPIKGWLLSLRDYLRGGTADVSRKLQYRMGLKSQQKAVLDMADILLPNADLEYQLIKRDFAIEKPYFVVPNAADSDIASGDMDVFFSEFGLKDFVLAVGSISIRKNYLSLIKALKRTGLKLVIVGKSCAAEAKYAELCRKEANEDVQFIDGLERDMLANAYAAAKVHVLPSWYETPGLASLEAGLAGCNIVTTDRGSTREYFGEFAWYCNPSDLSSIRSAVVNAYKAPRTDSLRELIAQRYTWKKAAEVTLEAYRSLLRRRPH